MQPCPYQLLDKKKVCEKPQLCTQRKNGKFMQNCNFLLWKSEIKQLRCLTINENNYDFVFKSELILLKIGRSHWRKKTTGLNSKHMTTIFIFTTITSRSKDADAPLSVFIDLSFAGRHIIIDYCITQCTSCVYRCTHAHCIMYI